MEEQAEGLSELLNEGGVTAEEKTMSAAASGHQRRTESD